MMVIKLGESSNIKEAIYDPVKKIVTIMFMNGIKYEYYDIEMDIVINWQKADSVGKYFAQHIRNKSYKRIN